MSHATGDTTANPNIELVKKRLLSGGAWALGGRVTLTFIGLATNALLARLLAPADLGAYFLAYSIVTICASLGTLGLKTAVVRFVAESVGLEQYNRTRLAIKLALGLGSLGATAVGFAYLLFGGAVVGSLFGSPALAAVAGVTGGWIIATALQGLVVETFRGFHDIRMTTTLGGISNGNGILTGGLLSLLLLLLLLFRGEAELATVMLLAVGSGAISALLAGLLLRRRVASLPEDRSGASFDSGEMIRVAWPLMVTTLALFALGQSSIWIAGAFLGQEEVALYGAAFRMMLYVALPLQIASMIAPPMIAEMYAQGRREELQSTLRGVATIAGIPALLLLTTFILFGAPILGFVFGEYYREASVILVLLSLGQIAHVLAGVGDQVLMMSGHQTTIMIVAFTAGLPTVACAIWAVQQYGVIGLSSSAAGGIIFQKIVMLLVVRRRVGIWTHVSLPGRLLVTRMRR